jgi:hypothetical protein
VLPDVATELFYCWEVTDCAHDATPFIQCDHLTACSVIGEQAKHVTAVGRITTSAVCGARPERGCSKVGGAALVCECW